MLGLDIQVVLRVELVQRVAPGLFGLAHGLVGVAHQGVRVGVVQREYRYAHTRRECDLLVSDGIGLCNALQQSLRLGMDTGDICVPG